MQYILFKEKSVSVLQREALEVGNGQLLVDRLEVALHSELLVPDVLLRKEAALLEELVQTTLGNVLNHGLVEVGSLLS